MGKASSSKKIKRVQQAGATRSPGQRREIGYPLAIGAILLVGLVLTAFAVMHRRDVEQVRPTVEDHWVATYGTYICDAYDTEPLENVVADTGADIHSDGLIHIHPTGPENAGENAVFANFMAAVGITVDANNRLTLPDGRSFGEGDDCNGEPARVALYQWPPQSDSGTDPRIITNDIAGTRFTQDKQIYALVFAPQGAEFDLPASTSKLDEPDDIDYDEPEVKDAAATTTTVAEGEPTDTTAVEGGGTDTPAGDGDTVETTVPEGDPTTTVGG